ncbi:MAG: large conductance mechanosensitive channel protein MscL, partial [Clostridia bacterium]
VIGGAFGKIVSSFVADIINPLIALVIGKGSFETLVLTLKEATADTTAITINIGVFLQAIFNFLIISLCIFTVMRMFMKVRKTFEKETENEAQSAAAVEPPKPSNDEITAKTLVEIKLLLEDIKKKQ